MELRISDEQRSRYTAIYGMDPLAHDGWLTRRLMHGLTIVGCDLAGDFDLLNVSDGQTLDAPAKRGTKSIVVQISKQREKTTSIFNVIVKWS